MAARRETCAFQIHGRFLAGVGKSRHHQGGAPDDDRESNSGFDLGRAFEMKCHRCGKELPLLHPHIVVERYDDEENVICESCFMNGGFGQE